MDPVEKTPFGRDHTPTGGLLHRSYVIELEDSDGMQVYGPMDDDSVVKARDSAAIEEQQGALSIFAMTDGWPGGWEKALSKKAPEYRTKLGGTDMGKMIKKHHHIIKRFLPAITGLITWHVGWWIAPA